jgi:hypothetical protein
MGLEGIGISSNVASSIIIPVPAPSTSRGAIVMLGKATSVNLNSVAQTTLFTTVAGFTKCRVTEVTVGNISGVATTASFSFGQSGTPTDWAATATYAGLSAAGKFVYINPATATGSAEITGTGVAFVINVTIGQGVATTADVEAWGYYE